MQNEEPKIFMSDEQFAWLKALELSRSKEMLARIDEQTGIMKAQEDRKGDDLRDMFAGQALSGLLASGMTYGGSTTNRAAVASDAYAHADAMIAARIAGVK